MLLAPSFRPLAKPIKRGGAASKPLPRCAVVTVCLLFLLVAQVDSVVNLLARGVEAGDEHHLVAVAAAHDLVVDALHVVARVNGDVVDVGDDETVAHASVLELAGLDADDLQALGDGEVLLLFPAQLGEGAAQRHDIALLGHLGAALVILEGDGGAAQLVVAVVFHLGLVAGTQLVHLLLHLATVLHARAVELDDDVALLQAGLLGGAAVGEIGRAHV